MGTTAGRPGSWGLIAALSAVALGQPLACGAPDPGPDNSAAIRAVLDDVWPEVVEPAVEAARIEAAALADATAAWEEAEAGGADPTASRTAAREAWGRLMDAWQVAEAHQIGPAASSLTAVAGADLRDRIYSWPTTNPCRVDQETVEAAYTNPDFFTVELVNVMGLDALETVLFSDDATNACPPQVDINASGSFDALGPDGVRASRAAYATALAEQIAVELEALHQAWDPAGDDFAASLAEAGEGTSPYETPDQGLNAVYDALFYLEIATKDRKLGEPLGLRDCGATSCLHVVETPVAGGSNAWIRANLAGFRALYLGGEGQGLDDLLRELDHEALALDLEAALDNADAAALGLQIPVDEAAATDPAEALALHAALDVLTDLLRIEVATALFLTVPDEAAGDND